MTLIHFIDLIRKNLLTLNSRNKVPILVLCQYNEILQYNFHVRDLGTSKVIPLLFFIHIIYSLIIYVILCDICMLYTYTHHIYKHDITLFIRLLLCFSCTRTIIGNHMMSSNLDYLPKDSPHFEILY